MKLIKELFEAVIAYIFLSQEQWELVDALND